MEGESVADLGGCFDASIGGFLPDRVIVRDDGFKRAFEEFRMREEAAGRRATMEHLAAAAGVNERVLRRARVGGGTLARHQILKLTATMGCQVADLILLLQPAENAEWREGQERCKSEMKAWPVPLRPIATWVDFLALLRRAEAVRTLWRDDVLDLAAAPTIDAFAAAIVYARRVAEANPAVAAAALKDAAADLAAHGLQVSEGRYMARRHSAHDGESVNLVRTMHVHVLRTPGDPAHVIDRTAEPMTTSDEEDYCFGDPDELWRARGWLDWEGKERLAMWI